MHTVPLQKKKTEYGSLAECRRRKNALQNDACNEMNF
jgi:hypothetical protein